MARESERVLRGRVEDVLPALLRAGGSPGGARPKVLVAVRGDEVVSGEDEIPQGFTPWIVKFRGRGDVADVGPLELAYSTMARQAGIDVPPTRLFEGRRDDRFFGVERFDRVGGERVHVHTFGNLVHSDFRVPSADYHQLLEVTRVLTRDHRDVVETFRRMVFNVLAHNRDDHVKNFAFRMSWEGEWSLAPAYDLVWSPGPGGEHSMTVDGEGRAPRREHLARVAEKAGIPACDRDDAIETVATAVEAWPTRAREVGVGEETTRDVERSIRASLAAVAE